MAEFVQESLEQMIPELELMMELDLFTQKEIKVMLSRRRMFEYRLQRRTKRKTDSLNYIRYEVGVLQLLRRRRKQRRVTLKKVAIDYQIRDRIHRMFGALCQRFPEDYKLWLSHIEFATKQRQFAYTGKIYTKMLRIHNKTPELWIKAAHFELNQLGHFEAARGLLLKGIRFNANSKLLWIEMYRFELIFAQGLYDRLEVLKQSTKLKEENLDHEECETSEKVEQTAQDERGLETGKTATVVFCNALDELGEEADIDFISELLSIAAEFDSLFELQAENAVVELERRHGVNGELCSLTRANICLLRAQRLLARTGSVTEGPKPDNVHTEMDKLEADALQQMLCSCEQIRSANFFNKCVCILQARAACAQPTQLSLRRIERLAELLKWGYDVGACLSEKHCVMYMDLALVSADAVDDRLIALLDDFLSKFPRSEALWAHYIQLKVTLDSQTDVVALFLQLLRSAKIRDSYFLVWMTLLETPASITFDYLLKVLDLLEQHRNRNILGVYEQVLERMRLFISSHIEATVKVISKVFERVPFTIEMVNSAVSLLTEFTALESTEKLQTSIKRQNAQVVSAIRLIFKRAVAYLGQDSVDVWLQYIQFERTIGSPLFVHQLHRQATAALPDDLVLDFNDKYTLLSRTSHS